MVALIDIRDGGERVRRPPCLDCPLTTPLLLPPAFRLRGLGEPYPDSTEFDGDLPELPPALPFCLRRLPIGDMLPPLLRPPPPPLLVGGGDENSTSWLGLRCTTASRWRCTRLVRRRGLPPVLLPTPPPPAFELVVVVVVGDGLRCCRAAAFAFSTLVLARWIRFGRMRDSWLRDFAIDAPEWAGCSTEWL